ncbi:MAG: YcgL domain-containing protein [Pseudomonadota bacterium]
MICDVYKSSRRPDLYLYVAKSSGLEGLPEALLAGFGSPEWVLTLHLTPEKALARARAPEVLASIEHQGYYLQMPPSPAGTQSKEADGND